MLKSINPLRLTNLPIFIFVGFIAYFNALKSDFLGDDYLRILDVSLWYRQGLLSCLSHIMPDRPLLILSTWINFQISSTNPLSYKVINVLGHSFCGYTLFETAKKIFSLLKIKYNPTILLLTTLIFVVHPGNNQAVNIIIQRSAIFSCVGVLWSIYFYIDYVQNKKRICLLLSILFYLVALGFKQNAIVLPLLILIYQLALKSYKLKLLVPYLLVSIIPFALYLGLNIDAQSRFEDRLGSIEYFMAQWKVIFYYLKIFITPIHLSYYYNIEQQVNYSNYVCLIGHLILMSTIIWASIKYHSKSYLIFLLIYVAFIPESSFFPIRHVIFEHRMYLPLGFFLIWVGLLPYKKKTIMALFCTLLIFTALNWQRNDQIDTVLKWKKLNYEVKKNDHTWVVFFISNLIMAKQTEIAREYLNRAIKDYPPDSDTKKRNFRILKEMINFDTSSRTERVQLLEELANYLTHPNRFHFNQKLRAISNRFILQKLPFLLDKQLVDSHAEKLITPQFHIMQKNIPLNYDILKQYPYILTRIKMSLLEKKKNQNLSSEEEKKLQQILHFFEQLKTK